jgi:hypothetical protein
MQRGTSQIASHWIRFIMRIVTSMDAPYLTD